MPASPSVDNYSLGKGIVYFDRTDEDGNATGELDLGNAPTFSILPTVETIAHFESRSGIKEKDLEVETTAGFTGKIILDEYSAENLLLAFRGDEVEYDSQGDGTVTDEGIVAHAGKWSKLLYRNVSNVVVTDVSGVTTYTENTDYTVDATIGRIKILSSGSITDLEALYVDYSYSASSVPRVSALTRSEIQGLIRFVGDPAVGPALHVVIWKVRMKCDADVNFISDDWGTISLSFEVLKDVANHPNDPWFKAYEMSADTGVGS